MISFIHRHNLLTLVIGLGLLGFCASPFALLALAKSLGFTGAGALAPLVVAGVATATGALAFALVVVVMRVEDYAQTEVDRALTALYGVPVERHAHGVWKVDGELRHAVLTSGPALLVGGRELPRVSA